MIRQAAFLLAMLAVTLPGVVQAGSPFAWPWQESGAIVASESLLADDIYPARVVAVDGRNIPARSTFWLVPGSYRLTVLPTEIRYPRGMQSAWRRMGTRNNANQLDLEVEAGKTYYLGTRALGRDVRNPYEIVVYRIEERP